MVKKPVVRILLVLSVLTLVGIAALAAAGRRGIVASVDGRQTIATHGPSSHIKPWADNDAGLTAIAGNLSKYPNGVFFCCYGFTISGPNSVIGATYWVGVPFTPSADSMVKKVEVSAAYVTGTNGVTLSVNSDAGGVPGAQLAGGNFTGLEAFGDCCQLVVASGKGGLPVKQGVQYWVVVSTSNATNDTWDAWAFNSTDMRLFPMAGYANGVWTAGQNLLPGYEVLGTIQ
ncbi:MAG: hypothetical protein ACRD3L_16760 [Terriglobales bacterium]